LFYNFLVHASDDTNVGNGNIICFRYFPNKSNRQIWRLEKEINSNISNLVNQCQEECRKQDLLQMILEGAKNYEGSNGLLSSSLSQKRFIIDNCKSIFFAGHDTTAITASWCLMLLAKYQNWQDRARAEVLEVCGNGNLDADILRTMKTVCFHQSYIFPYNIFNPLPFMCKLKTCV
jgi:cytochrome P450 family 714 subfamily C